MHNPDANAVHYNMIIVCIILKTSEARQRSAGLNTIVPDKGMYPNDIIIFRDLPR